MVEPRRPRRQQQAAPTIVSWITDEAYEYIVQVLGHAEKIPQRYDYTLGTEEMLRRLRARYGAEHRMRCVGLLRWHLGLAEDNEVVDETIWRNWRNYFARHRVGTPLVGCLTYPTPQIQCVDQAEIFFLFQEVGGSGSASTLQERIQMWDDGNAERLGQIVTGCQESTSSGTLSRSLGRLKRSLGSTIDRFKGK